ncbi:hypothetical protein IQ235_04705 [Oscillatoriales cyanobacterium LEGE 11467]|uniref:Uncharacterized protein n=1 Tax=Zarconia navalis LEGE 11467 TaxID=1828826 RepID=A0A928VTQ3_9CYAN|nr:hypothetical protein [Zarconia navalis]MBE9040092.1 hypothetical protein [Zarconia navalis LEGE 11467]
MLAHYTSLIVAIVKSFLFWERFDELWAPVTLFICIGRGILTIYAGQIARATTRRIWPQMTIVIVLALLIFLPTSFKDTGIEYEVLAVVLVSPISNVLMALIGEIKKSLAD